MWDNYQKTAAVSDCDGAIKFILFRSLSSSFSCHNKHVFISFFL